MAQYLSDSDRLDALDAAGLLDTVPEPSFDRLTRLAARLTNAPMALVSIVDEDRQFFKSCVGLPEPWCSTRESPLSHSFCQHVVNSGRSFVVDDARAHTLVRDNRAVPEMGVLAYAGVPLVNREGHVLGSFCALDTQPHQWTEDDLQTLEDLAASVMTAIELHSDARERARAESALRESEQRFRSLVETASDIIYGTDSYGFFTYVNPVAAKIMGFPSEELVGMHFTQLVREDARPEVDKFYRHQFRNRIESTYHEFPAMTASGRNVWIGQKVRLVIENNWIAGAQAVARDITEQRELDRMKDEFVSVVSHELRTPLTSLRGSLGLLASGKLSPDQIQRMLEIAVMDSDRLVCLINDFLELERIKSGRATLNMEYVELSKVVAAAVASVSAEAKRLGIAIETAIPAGQVKADADRMTQVLVNLLSNALKFSDPDSKVQVSATRGGKNITISVTDSGRGIPAQDLESIFLPFHQVDASDSRDRGGTGLGLSIARSIVEHHQGSLTVESTSGRGSTFTVRLPA